MWLAYESACGPVLPAYQWAEGMARYTWGAAPEVTPENAEEVYDEIMSGMEIPE